MIENSKRILLTVIFVFSILSCFKNTDDLKGMSKVTMKDSFGSEIKVSASISHIICSGAGCLRYITYMQCQDKVIAVDDVEKEKQQFDARPYAFANPKFKELPLFGEMRGYDNPELIIALQPIPDIIFKTYPEMGFNPVELSEKTNIPVFTLDYGDLGTNKASFYHSLELIGKVMKKEKRAGEIVEYIEKVIDDLNNRTKGIENRKTCFIGGVAYRGPLGLQSTEPGYPPFVFLNTPNAAIPAENRELSHMDVSKEKIVEWNPEIIFIDLATFQSDPQANALYELKTDPAYRTLQAVKSGNIFGVLPYNWYTQNHGSTLSNAYYIGKVLYPDRFADIDPIEKADEFYTFLVGKPVFTMMNKSFNGLAYKKLEL